MGIRKKLLLIKPYNLSDHIQPCIGLGMLATAVRDAHDVVIIDGIREKLTPEKMAAVVAAHQPDVIGWQLFTFDLQVVRAAAQAVKRCNPAIITIAGGPHPSTMPAETLAYFGAALDYAFAGEAEIALRRFLDGAPLGEVPGLAWRDGDTVRTNERQLVDDLDSLGMPAWDLIKPETYPEAQHGAFFEKFPIAPIMVTRGCPFHCTFCSGYLVSGHKVRVRSAEHVLREIQYLYTERGIREFHIIDDNFTMKRDYVIDFLRKLKALNLDISWATPNGVRMDTLDDEMLTLMKETGLYLISVAAESGSDRILAAMRKSLTVAKTREAVAMIRRHGIDMAGFFIIGFPGETRADVEATIALALELPLIRANFFTYLPFPGTESYRQLEESGELAKVDWERFFFMNAAFTPRGFTRAEIKRLQRRAFLSFYLRPRIFWKNITAIKSARHFWFLLRRFTHWA